MMNWIPLKTVIQMNTKKIMMIIKNTYKKIKKKKIIVKLKVMMSIKNKVTSKMEKNRVKKIYLISIQTIMKNKF